MAIEINKAYSRSFLREQFPWSSQELEILGKKRWGAHYTAVAINHCGVCGKRIEPLYNNEKYKDNSHPCHDSKNFKKIYEVREYLPSKLVYNKAVAGAAKAKAKASKNLFLSIFLFSIFLLEVHLGVKYVSQYSNLYFIPYLIFSLFILGVAYIKFWNGVAAASSFNKLKKDKFSYIYNNYTVLNKNFTITNHDEAKAISDELNRYSKYSYKDNSYWEKILTNLKIMDEYSPLIVKNPQSTTFEKFMDKTLYKGKPKEGLREKIVYGVVNKPTSEELFNLNLNSKGFIVNFTHEELQKINEVNKLLQSYQVNELSEQNKVIYNNCHEEFEEAFKLTVKNINEDNFNEAFKKEFIVTVNNCLLILSTIKNLLLEAELDKMKVSNIFLKDKYSHILKNSEDEVGELR